MALNAHRPTYWHMTLRITAPLLGLWLLVTLGVCLWLPGLDVSVMGWPLGYWAASQGALSLYVLVVWVYAWRMDRLDAEQEPSQDD